MTGESRVSLLINPKYFFGHRKCQKNLEKKQLPNKQPQEINLNPRYPLTNLINAPTQLERKRCRHL